MTSADAIEAKTRTVPTERSIPPAMITKVCPTDRTRRIAALMASIDRLKPDRELFWAQSAVKIAISAISENENPSPAKRAGSSARRRSRVVRSYVVRSRRLRSCSGCAPQTRSRWSSPPRAGRHSRPAPRKLRHAPSETENLDAVGDREHLRHVVADQHNSDSGVAHPSE